jgi:DNA polymerase type B, organellar and viral
MFRIDILKYSTLSSLAFAIFRTNFLKDSKIPLIHGEMYDFIKESYTGGSVDVYKPKPSSNKKVYRYDVNSLYPYAMKHYPMPVGDPTYFEGDILQNYDPNNKPFGIFEVDVVAPSNIKLPLLQTRMKTKKYHRTVAPLGSWSGVYFSDELYNAAKFGYSYKVKRGYLFEKGYIFTEYVDFLYNLKEQSKKGTPIYIISKLLLNSLYGRLGMNPIAEQHVITTNEKAIKLYSKFNITNILDLKNGKELISFFNLASDENEDSNFNIKETSVAIASAVTASARIHMSIFKANTKLEILYSDTDSIDLEEPLESKYVGTKLGEMKLEHIFDEAIFLGPKMYGGKTSEYEYVKIKGLKNPISFDELKPLLKKGSSLEVEQEKWYSDFSNAQFHIKDELYTLMVTDNKRELLYSDGEISEFIDTKPLLLDNGVLVKQEEN